MSYIIKVFTISLCIIMLSSCMAVDDNYYGSSGESIYTYDTSPSPNLLYYRTGNYPTTNYSSDNPKMVNTADSYPTSEIRSPISSKDMDRTWVRSQNAQGYTIEVADGEKASQVAQTLYKAPKNERMAQVKYQRQGKTYYKGLYGSYDSPEAAQKALDALPPDIKQGAGVKNWGVVKGAVNEF